VRRAIAQTGQKITGLMPEKRDTTTPKGGRLLKAFDSLSVVKAENELHGLIPLQIQ